MADSQAKHPDKLQEGQGKTQFYFQPTDYEAKFGIGSAQMDLIRMKYRPDADFITPQADAEKEYAIDQIIIQMMDVKDSQWGKPVKLDFRAIKFLIEESTKIIQADSMLLDLEAPIKIFGDVHGQYFDLFRLFDVAGYPSEDNQKFLFIGDYVDRGKQSIETICLLLAFKIKYPKKIFLLRGNHECQSINRMYGFYDECKRRYSVKIWKEFGQCFDVLPVCAIVDDRILCMHGGLSPDLNDTLEIINQ